MELIESTEPYLCLNMIVKNEGHIIKDTLTKLLNKVPLIDYWVISDTGSTDETKKIISDFFKERNINGELFDDESVQKVLTDWEQKSPSFRTGMNATQEK